MAARLLLTGAGTGATNNLVRSLRTGDPSLFIVGCHDDRFVLKKSTADLNYLVPHVADPRFVSALARVAEAARIDLLVPTTDAVVATLAVARERVPCRLVLPADRVIELCQDKCELASFLRARGVPAPLTFPVIDLDAIEDLFERLAPHPLAWCRIRTGSGAMGALPVRSAEQARAWIGYWQTMRRVPATSFTLSEYLPGRDFSCQSLWQDGRLRLAKTCERLSYFGGAVHPSGISSVSALARTVVEPRVVEVCVQAGHALDAALSGPFNFDLKEDAAGVPCITEINAGRFPSGTAIFDFTGRHNLAVTYVRLALGEPVDIAEPYDAAEGYYSIRDLDTEPGLFHADDLFEGIEDARG